MYKILWEQPINTCFRHSDRCLNVTVFWKGPKVSLIVNLLFNNESFWVTIRVPVCREFPVSTLRLGESIKVVSPNIYTLSNLNETLNISSNNFIHTNWDIYRYKRRFTFKTQTTREESFSVFRSTNSVTRGVGLSGPRLESRQWIKSTPDPITKCLSLLYWL